MLLRELLSLWAQRFATAGIDSAEADAELLFAFVAGMSRGEVQAAALSGAEVSLEQQANFEELAARREAREPLQHLTGVAHFRHITLAVGKGVFVPRPETELLAGLGIEFLKTLVTANPLAFDLCSGSGAIALSLAHEVPSATVVAIEKSEDAFAWAKRNFENYKNATIILGDIADGSPQHNGKADVVLTNPPYIPTEMVPIYPEVALHDPSLALFGGDDGLDVVRIAERTAHELLREGGFFAIEHADIQAKAITDLLLARGWQNVVSHQDFNGRDRVVSATR
ncbi:MAG: peptide chain release factor N(5)-glutamine methyltransferase [Micrococcales bacterium]